MRKNAMSGSEDMKRYADNDQRYKDKELRRKERF